MRNDFRVVNVSKATWSLVRVLLKISILSWPGKGVCGRCVSSCHVWSCVACSRAVRVHINATFLTRCGRGPRARTSVFESVLPARQAHAPLRRRAISKFADFAVFHRVFTASGVSGAARPWVAGVHALNVGLAFFGFARSPVSVHGTENWVARLSNYPCMEMCQWYICERRKKEKNEGNPPLTKQQTNNWSPTPGGCSVRPLSTFRERSKTLYA